MRDSRETTRPGKREKAAERNRAKIINTTIRLLIKEGGSASVSAIDICAAANLTRPTFYHYFAGKRDLLLAVHKTTLERDLKPYTAEAAAIKDPFARLQFMVRAFTRIICLHPEVRVLIHDTLTKKDKYFAEVRREWKQHYTLLRDTIAELRSARRIASTIKPSWAALFVLGMLAWVAYWFDYGKKESIDAIAESAVGFVLNGIGFRR
jgi:AcrR family transcriptional regulator